MIDEPLPVFGAVLCAGLGTRMRPLTDALPKPLLPFLNTPLITYALNHLARAGVTHVGCNLHHLADAIPPVVDRISAQFDLEPVYTREWELLGTAGGVRGIWKALGEPQGTLICLNGDSVMNLELAEHLTRHRASGAQATLVVRERADDQPGKIWLDAQGILQGIRDHRRPGAPPDDQLTEYDFVGVHVLEHDAIAPLELEHGDILTELHGPMLEDDGPIHASVMGGFWAALDTPQLYMETTRRCLAQPDLFEQAPMPEPMAQGLHIYRPGTIDGSTQLAAPVFTGLNTSLAAGVRLGPDVVLDGVEVSPGACIENAVLFGMGRIEGEWRDCIGVAGKIASLPGVAGQADEEE